MSQMDNVSMKLVVYGFGTTKPSWVVTRDSAKGETKILASSIAEPCNFFKNESILLFGNNMELHIGDVNGCVGDLKQFKLYDISTDDLNYLNDFMAQAGCEFSYEVR